MAERPAFFARRTSGRMQGQIRCKLTENAAMEGNMLRQDVVPKTVSFGDCRLVGSLPFSSHRHGDSLILNFSPRNQLAADLSTIMPLCQGNALSSRG